MEQKCGQGRETLVQVKCMDEEILVNEHRF